MIQTYCIQPMTNWTSNQFVISVLYSCFNKVFCVSAWSLQIVLRAPETEALCYGPCTYEGWLSALFSRLRNHTVAAIHMRALTEGTVVLHCWLWALQREQLWSESPAQWRGRFPERFDRSIQLSHGSKVTTLWPQTYTNNPESADVPETTIALTRLMQAGNLMRQNSTEKARGGGHRDEWRWGIKRENSGLLPLPLWHCVYSR